MALAALATSTLLLGACSSGAEGSADATPTSTAAQTFTQQLPETTAVVVEPGSDPRRLRFAAEARQTVAVHLVESVDARPGGVPSPPPRRIDAADVRLDLEVRATPVTSAGNHEVRATVTAARVAGVADPAAAARSEGFVFGWDRPLTGAAGNLVIVPAAGNPDPARAATERVATALSYAAVVFPDAPVGVGGSWTVTQRIDDLVPVEQVTTYTLVSASGSVLELDVRSTQRAVGGAGRASTDLTATGRLTVDTAVVLPVGGSLRYAGTTRVPAEQGSLVTERIREVTWGA